MVTASSLYAILAYDRLHSNTLLLDSGGNLFFGQFLVLNVINNAVMSTCGHMSTLSFVKYLGEKLLGYRLQFPFLPKVQKHSPCFISSPTLLALVIILILDILGCVLYHLTVALNCIPLITNEVAHLCIHLMDIWKISTVSKSLAHFSFSYYSVRVLQLFKI